MQYGKPIGLLLLCLLCLLFSKASQAVAPAGSIIKNQASASYRDTQGVKRIATSNVVETLIRQVAAFNLTLSQRKPGVAGQEVSFTHTLVNTGNGADQFTLNAVSGGADFNLTDVAIYPDSDRDGLPDSYVSISASPLLQSGDSWGFVVAGHVPPGALNGESGRINVTAASVFDGTVTENNQDTVVVSDSAVVVLSKELSNIEGASPDGPVTVRIHYRNSSAVDATDVTLIDALPQGMVYLAGSGRSSVTGTLVLTDNDAGDVQSGVRYCAYHSSCSGLIEANSDSDSDSTNQVTAIIDSVAAGQHGYIVFDVSIAAGMSSGVLFNTAELQYIADGNPVGRIKSNPVPFTIIAGANVVINGSNTSSVDGTDEPRLKTDSVFGASSGLPVCQSAGSDPDGDGYGFENGAQCIVPDLQAGNSLFYRNTIWNLGNGLDTFDITAVASSFPANTVFRLLKSDAQTPLLDTNGNGVPDTGPMPRGASQEIVLQVVLPAGVSGNNGTDPFSVTTVATSTVDSSASNTMINLLQNITGGSVDITNVAPLGDPLVLGAGPGPETTAVQTFQLTPGGQVDIDLVVNNTSAFPMEYQLAASIFSDFSTLELPANWQLVFMVDGAVSSSTGVIGAGESVPVTARVTVPPEAAASLTSLYFRARNERYAVEDVKRDAIEIEALQTLLLGINQEGQTQPGGSRVYHHSLANTGNVDINNIALSTTDSLSTDGWSSSVYQDTDGDGVLSAADLMVNSVSLAAGQSTALFVKVYAPATAAGGSANFTQVFASSASETLSVTDITNVTSGEISVLKEQALDNQCDGVLDSGYSSNMFSVEPGDNCVSYRLTAYNAGSESVMNVVVADATPAFTSYTGTAQCSHSACTLTEPASGGAGEIIASLPVLPSGDSVVVEFRVRID